MHDTDVLLLAAGQMEMDATFARPELAEILRQAGEAFTRAAGGIPGVPEAAGEPQPSPSSKPQAHLN